MRWFRANRMVGGRLALFALALQLVLSFGHIHPEDLFGSAKRGAVSVSTVLPSAAEVTALSGDQASQQADDYCAICATTALLNTSFVAAAPQLPLPGGFRAVEQLDRVAALFVAPRRAPFQSRAPPAA